MIGNEETEERGNNVQKNRGFYITFAFTVQQQFRISPVIQKRKKVRSIFVFGDGEKKLSAVSNQMHFRMTNVYFKRHAYMALLSPAAA